MDVALRSTTVEPRLYPPSVNAVAGALPLWRFLPTFVRNPIRSLPAEIYHEPILVVRHAGRTTAWITSPSLIEDVLLTRADTFGKSPIEKRVFDVSLGDGILTSEGALWRWQRRVLAPLFRPSEIARYVPDMSAVADELLERWRRDPAGCTQPIDADMTEATFAVIARTMLIGGEPAEGEIIKRATHAYLERVSWEVAYGLLQVPAWVWNPAKGQMRRAAAELRGAVNAIVDRRERDGGDGTDLLGRLLAARDPDTSEPMPRARLVNNLLTLLEAGHETTAKALTWTLYLLARSPAWQSRIRNEVIAVAGRSPVGADHIPKLVLTQQVLKEAMRLYPPAPVIVRQAREATMLGTHMLAQGGMVVIPIYALHRHRKLWEDPDAFMPERFAPELEAKIARTQFMPFGGGPRICLGAAFAMLEATAILATLVRGAAFDWDGKHLPEPISRVTLRPKGGMPLKVTPL